MRDVDENEVRERLLDLAGDVGLPSRLERPTIRRARRRRAVTGAATAVVVVALLGGSYTGMRAVLSGPSTLGTEPSPTPSQVPPGTDEPFVGIWPETTWAGLASGQAAIDDGHQPWRVDAEMTASAFAVGPLGWDPTDVTTETVSRAANETVVAVANTRLPEGLETRVVMRQLGRTGANAVWSVVRAETDAITIDIVPEMIRPGDHLGLAVTLSPSIGEGRVVASLLDGPILADAVSGTLTRVDDRAIGEVPIPASDDGTLTLLVRAIDPDRTTLAAVAFALPVETAADPSPSRDADIADADVTGVPSVVAATAERIHDAALARDFDTLAALMDPDIFVYNFDDGSNPIPAWREDPEVLDTAAAILEMPPAAVDVEGMGRFYIWPYLMEADLTDPTPAHLRDLDRLGIGAEELREMLRHFGGYVGPRLAIDETGLWRNFVLGGD